MYRTHKSRILFVGPYVSNTRKTWLIIQLWKKHASEQQRRRHQRCQTPQRRTHWPLATKFFRTAESLTSPLCCRRALVNLITVDNVHATISKQVHYQSIISVAICHWLTTTSSECCSACGNKYSEVWLTGVNFNYTMKHIFHWLTCLTASSSGRQWWFTVVWTVCPLNASLNYLFRSHANHRWYSSRSAILVIYSLCPQSLQ